MLAQLAEPMPLYVPPEKSWTLKLRSDEAFKAQLQDVVRLWKIHAQTRGDDVEAIDLSYVVRRFLEVGIEQTFEEYGGRPKTETAWAKLEGDLKHKAPKR